MEATAEHDFAAKADDELSFRKGNLLTVINIDEDPHWYKAELDGREGFIPSNYIKLHDNHWYMGKMTRADAEIMLRRPSMADGSFIVRQSESSPGNYSLSVKYSGGVQHFKVLRDRSGYYIWTERFPSVNRIIDYHRQHSVSKTHTLLLVDLDPSVKRRQKLVQAMFDFVPQEDGELAFKRGDIITVTNEDDQNWWEGTLNGRQGMFPATYVCPFNRNA